MYHILEIQTFENGASVIVHDANGAIPQTMKRWRMPSAARCLAMQSSSLMKKAMS